MFVKIFVLFFFFMQTNRLSDATCRYCHAANGVACLSETEFMFCGNGPSKTLKCPEGQVCVSNAAICQDAFQVEPACVPSCGKCSNDKRFACIDETHFALCFGTDIPQMYTLTECAAGKACAITVSAPNFCESAGFVTTTCAPGEVWKPVEPFLNMTIY